MTDEEALGYPDPNDTVQTTQRPTALSVLRGLWRIVVRPLLVLVISVGVILFGIYRVGKYAVEHYYSPVNPQDDTPIVVQIPKGMPKSEIAKLLESSKVVRNGNVFKYYVDILGYSSKIKAGSYVMNQTMTIDEIVRKLMKGDNRANTTSLITIEGNNINEIADSLVTQKVIANKTSFLSLCKDGKAFMEYSLIGMMETPDDKKRRYVLEGYLFPAKYEIYVGASEEDIISKMLVKMESVFTEKWHNRADELNMTPDEVITLASIIEKESKKDDFAKVSAVFHNRLNKKDKLGSDVTVQYVLGTKRLALTSKDIAVDSPYNTYKYPGLPLGPICNPSQAAIEAALYPNEAFMEEGYYFFVSKDPKSGELEFNKTQKEHDAAAAEYRPLWEAFDKENNR